MAVFRKGVTMKIAYSSLCAPAWDLETLVAKAAEYGYDGFELRGLRGELNLPLCAELTRDPKSVRAVKELFVELTRAGGTVFMSTHTLDIAEAVADRIGIIRKGQLIATGTLSELRAQARREHSLEEIFLQLTEAEPETENV